MPDVAHSRPAPERTGSVPGSPRILCIVTAFNEEGSVADVVRQIHETIPGGTALVIDDGSRDATARVAREAGARVVRLPFNSGIGTAVQTGFLVARDEGFDFAVQVDGDGQHPPDQVLPLVEHALAEGCNYVIGSRFVARDGAYRPSRARKGGITLFARLVSLVVGQRMTDTTSGLRVADRRTIALFATHYPYDYPEVEAIVLARRFHLKVAEVPVAMRHRESGRSSITPLRSVYYMTKVTLAVLIQAVSRRPRAEELH